jgi:hypothetical protein
LCRNGALAEQAVKAFCPSITWRENGTRPLPDHFTSHPRAERVRSNAFGERGALQPQQYHPTIQESEMDAKSERQVAFTKKEPPRWLLDMWKEIDDKTFGKGFDCFTEDAVCNLGVADWKGREAIRTNLKAFIDTGFTARHHVTEYWDAGFLKVFRGVVDMKPDDRSRPTVHPSMSHFFYMDEKDQTKVRWWVGAVGPVSFS